MAKYRNEHGLELECPHGVYSEYGDRIPTHEDALALTQLARRFEEDGDIGYLIQQAISSYCRQFRDVAGPSKEG